ncbi:expressed unknown protein [Seminavis robusta]|uniref:Uncharacterized protein n=1 Tax=Seminavis robusta TaxID=568900 RepID=A0A9N8HLF9_9STRA|nr:expressed unknown protein [Seminavis robusta]|eukprot:Sro680_g186230.1 n/a (775) ;mRNA; r:26375-28699
MSHTASSDGSCIRQQDQSSDQEKSHYNDNAANTNEQSTQQDCAPIQKEINTNKGKGVKKSRRSSKLAGAYTGSKVHRRAVKRFGNQVKAVIEVRMRLLAAVVLQSWFRMVRCRRRYLTIFSSMRTVPINNHSVSQLIEQKDTEAMSCISSLSSWSSTWNRKQPSLRLISTESIQYNSMVASGGAGVHIAADDSNPHQGTFHATQEDKDAIKNSITAYTSIVQLQNWWRALRMVKQAAEKTSVRDSWTIHVEEGDEDDEDDEETDDFDTIQPTPPFPKGHNVIATMEITTRKVGQASVATEPTTAESCSSETTGPKPASTACQEAEEAKDEFDKNSNKNSNKTNTMSKASILLRQLSRKSEDTVPTSNTSRTFSNENDDDEELPMFCRIRPSNARRRQRPINKKRARGSNNCEGYEFYADLWSSTIDQISECEITPPCNIELTPSALVDCHPDDIVAECHREDLDCGGSTTSGRPDSPLSHTSTGSETDRDTYEVILTSATGEEPGCHVISSLVSCRPSSNLKDNIPAGCAHSSLKEDGMGCGGDQFMFLDGIVTNKREARKQAMAAAAAKLYACKRPKEVGQDCQDDPTLYYVPTTEVEPMSEAEQMSEEEEFMTNPSPSFHAFSSPSTYTMASHQTAPGALSSPTTCSDNSRRKKSKPVQPSPKKISLADYCSVPNNISTRTSSSESVSSESSYFSIDDKDLKDDSNAFGFVKVSLHKNDGTVTKPPPPRSGKYIKSHVHRHRRSRGVTKSLLKDSETEDDTHPYEFEPPSTL